MPVSIRKDAGQDFAVPPGWLAEFGPVASTEHIARLSKDNVTVKTGRGQYLAGASLRNLWRRELEIRQATALGEKQPDPFQVARIENLRSNTRRNDLEIAKEEGELIPVATHVEVFAGLSKYLATFLDTLPDVLERSAGLSPQQVSKLQARIVSVRADLYEHALSVVVHGKPAVRWTQGGGPDAGDSAAPEAKPRQRKRRSQPEG